MTVNVATIEDTCPTTPGNKTFESAGFGQPQAAIVTITAAYDTNNPRTTQGALCVGFIADNNQGCVSVSNSTNGDSNRAFSQANPVYYIEGLSAVVVATFVQFTADGLTLNFVNVPSSEYRVHITFLRNLANTTVFNLKVTGTTVNVTSLTFKPDFVLAITNGDSGAQQISIAHSIFSYGFAYNDSTNTVTEGLIAASGRTGTTSRTTATRNDGSICQFFDGSFQWISSLSNFNNTGFTITSTANPAGDTVIFLCLKFEDPDDAHVEIIDTATSPGVVSYDGPGFTPAGLLFATSVASTLNASNTHYGLGLGHADNSEQHSMGTDARSGSTVNVSSYYDSAAVGHLYNPADGSLLVRALVQSYDANGYNLNYTVADATPRKWVVASFKGEAIAPVLQENSIFFGTEF